MIMKEPREGQIKGKGLWERKNKKPGEDRGGKRRMSDVQSVDTDRKGLQTEYFYSFGFFY